MSDDEAVDELAEARAEIASLQRAIAALNLSVWHQIEQMHDFEAARDGRCPSCGGPARTVLEDGREGQPEGIRFETVAA
jgi:DNA repair exonuclease SbcCD ATPase subunit